MPGHKKIRSTMPSIKEIVKPKKGNILDSFTEKDFMHLNLLKGNTTTGIYHPQLDETLRLGGNMSIGDADADEDYTGFLAANQPFNEKLSNMFKGGFYNTLAGITQTFDYDIPDMARMLAGKEGEYGSWLSRIADDLKDKSESYQIHQEGHSYSDPNWWMNMYKTMGYTAGMIGANIGIGMATSGVGVALGLGRMGLMANLVYGSVTGVHEGYVNGKETHDSVKAKYLSLGYDELEAKKYASHAATSAYRMEIGPIMILNALQYGAIGKLRPKIKSTGPFTKVDKGAKGLNLGASGAVESLFDLGLNKLPKMVKRPLSFLSSSASEAIEEGFQYGVGSYAEHKELVKSNEKFVDFDLYTDEFYDSMIMGGIGGGFFSSMGSMRNFIQKKHRHKVEGQMMDKFLKSVDIMGISSVQELRKAHESGNQFDIDSIRYRMQKENVFNSLRMDEIRKKETAFQSYVEMLEHINEAAKSKNYEALEKYGIKDQEDLDFIGENYDTYIKDAHKIKSNFIKNYNEVQNFHIAASVTDAEQIIDDTSEYINRNNKSKEDSFTNDISYQSLTEKGKAIAKLISEKEAIFQRAVDRTSKKKLKKNKVKFRDKKQKQRYEEIESEIKKINEDESYKKSDKDKDAEITSTIDLSVSLTNDYDNLINEEAIDLARKTIKHWSDPKNVEAEKKRLLTTKAKNFIEQDDIDSLIEEIKENGLMTPELEEILKGKVKKSKIKKDTKEDNKKNAQRNVQEEPEPNKETKDVSEEEMQKEIDDTMSEEEYKNRQAEEASKNENSEASVIPDIEEDFPIDALEQKQEEYPIELLEQEEEKRRKEEEEYPVEALEEQAENRRQEQEELNEKNESENNIEESLNQLDNVVLTKSQISRQTEEDSLFSIVSEEELSDDKMSRPPATIDAAKQKELDDFTVGVKKMYNFLSSKKEGTVTFKELLEEYMEEAGAYRIKNGYNAFKYAWNKNGYAKTDFKAVYDDLFVDLKAEINASMKILDGRDMSIDEVEKANNESLEKVKKDESPITGIDEKGNVQKEEYVKPIAKSRAKTIEEHNKKTKSIIGITEDGKNIYEEEVEEQKKTSNSDFKAAFSHIQFTRERVKNKDGTYSIIYTDNVSKLNKSANVKSLLLLRPDVANTGDRLSIRRPDNFEDILVYYYEDDADIGTQMTFKQWLNKTGTEEFLENRTPNPKYVNKIPLIAYDKAGTPLFFIHDTEWYRSDNIGYDGPGDTAKKYEIITEAKEKLNHIRHKAYNKKSVEIEITVKRAGIYNKIEESTSLNNSNPEIEIGISNESENVTVVGGDNFGTGNNKIIKNSKYIKKGHIYQVFQGVNTDEYLAFNILYTRLAKDVQQTIKKVIELYLYQHDKSNKISDNKKNLELRKKILKITGLDVYKVEDLDKYLKLYTSYYKGLFKSGAEVIQKVEDDEKYKRGRPYIKTVKGSLVFGIKGVPISGQAHNGHFLNPLKINDGKENNPNYGANLMRSYIKNIDKVIERFSQNGSIEGLSENIKTFIIDQEGNVIEGKRYEEYLKDVLRTNVKSYNIGTQKEPMYATVVQPVINFKEVDSSWEKYKRTGEVSEEAVKEIVEEVIEGKPLDAHKEEMKETSKKEVMKKVLEEEFKEKEEEELRKKEYKEFQEELDEEERLKKFAPKVNSRGFNKKEIKTLKSLYKSLLELGTKPSDDIMTYIKKIAGTIEGYESNVKYVKPDEEEDKLINDIKEELLGIKGLTIIQHSQIFSFVYNEISKKLSFKYKEKTSKNKILGEVRKSYLNIIKPLFLNHKKILEDLIKISSSNKNPTLEILINKLRDKIEVFEILEENWVSIENKILDKIKKESKLKEVNEEDEIENIDIQTSKIFNKTSLEINSILASSYEMKRFFDGIRKVDQEGKIIKGFLGVDTYVGFKSVYYTIQQILTTPNESESDFNILIERLKESKTAHPFITEVVDKLEKASQQMKNRFVYDFGGRHALRAEFTMFNKNRDGTYTLKVFESNSNEITRVIRDAWKNSFNISPLTDNVDGKNVINKDVAIDLLNEFNQWKKDGLIGQHKVDITNAVLIEWLSNFGINLSNQTLEDLREGKEYMTFQGIIRPKKFYTHFDETHHMETNSIFSGLAKYLENMINSREIFPEYEENSRSNPFVQFSGIVKTLSFIESRNKEYPMPTAFRDNEKNFYGITQSKMVTDTVDQLKRSQEFRDQFSNKSYNKHSYILDLLNNNKIFNGKFKISHVGNTALKQLGKSIFGEASITSLPGADYELARWGLFQDLKQGEINAELHGIKLRLATMFAPTMSEKTTMVTLKTAVLDLSEVNFHVDVEKNSVKMKDMLIEAMYSQLVTPELDRMTNFNFSLQDSKINIEGYSKAAQLFLFIPEMNNLQHNGESVLMKMIQEPGTYNMAWFEANMKKDAKKIIENLVDTKVKEKIKVWEKDGFITKNKKNNTASFNFVDKDYFSSARLGSLDLDTKIKIAAYDYVINSQLTYANTFMLLAGDIALYSQDKIKNYFVDGEVWNPKEEYGREVYSTIVEDVIGVNLSKRLASLIAPRSKKSNSKEESYLQLFLRDHVNVASTIVNFVEMFYDEKSSKYVEKQMEDYNNMTNENDKKILAKELALKFPLLDEYFDIETTDAQEYTTISEHVNLLFGQGRLEDDVHKSILSKIKIQLEAEEKGLEIPEAGFLSSSEKKTIFQPFKPLHTGFKNEEEFDVMRMVYIKTSAFPLLPELTLGTELDGVRKLLEKTEKRRGQSVRASYQSGNKVGSVSTPLSIFLHNGKFNKDLTDKQIDMASLVLSRNNFGIQNDIPYKSDKRSFDKVSMVTQANKLLFSDGMLNISGMEKLKEEHDLAYDNYILLKRKLLFKRLGLDNFGEPISIEDSMNKLQNLLKEEAFDRGYDNQSTEGLKLIPKLDNDDNIIGMEFSIPLWMSGNTYKYEALLNSIVNKELVDVKMPGHVYVLGSETGFKFQEDFEGIKKNRIIYTSAYKGELRGYEKGKPGQVFLPSKFRDNNGKLIEFIDKDGNYNRTYVEKNEDGRLMLKEGMISKELLNINSFRIPNSGHVSMSNLDIAGFLPDESGDLMIGHRSLMAQKGTDNDGDTETIYYLNTHIDSQGKIIKLNEKVKKEILDEIGPYYRKIDNSEENFDSNDVELENKKREKHEKFIGSENDKLELKILENKLVDTYTKVLSDPNPEVQRKINGVLSMRFARKQRDLISKALREGKDNTYFTILDDEYQKSQMELNASGQLTIGAYSNAVTFHGLASQVSKKLQLYTYSKKHGYSPFRITMGNQTSNGILGEKFSLAKHADLKRSVADNLGEKQNTSMDNAREGILGAVNINKHTIHVDVLLSYLRLDKDHMKDPDNPGELIPVSLSYLFISQPVIREYVELMRQTEKSTGQYDPSAREGVIAKLMQKYEGDEDIKVNISSQLTGQELYNNLSNPSRQIQEQVLINFLKLSSQASNLNKLQRILDINKNGLGKSYFDVIEKFEAIQNIYIDNEYDGINHKENHTRKNIFIRNAKNIVGDYVRDDDKLSDGRVAELTKEGYILLGDFYIKPNNPIGSMLINSVDVGYNLWKPFFPYDDDNIKIVMDQILKMTAGENPSPSKKVKEKQHIFKEIKKSIVTSGQLKLYKGTTKEARRRLFIDNNEDLHSSLSSYLNRVLLSNTDTSELLGSNKLISMFLFKNKNNKQPSLIKFDNAKGEDYDEDYLYLSLIELMDQNFELPDFNGEQYNTRALAKDLIAYAYLEGGIQEATQFVKYIPVSYLNTIDFGSFMRRLNPLYNPAIFEILLKISNDYKTPSYFTRHYAQHNPEKLIGADSDSFTDRENSNYNGNPTGKLKDLTSFELYPELPKGESLNNYLEQRNFVSIYDNSIESGLKKFHVFERDGFTFNKISTLGTFGMSEYKMGEKDITSIVNSIHKQETIIHRK